MIRYDAAYKDFTHKDRAFYIRIARECDSLLQKSNEELIEKGANQLSSVFFNIAPTNLMISRTLNDLQPTQIRVGSNCVALHFTGSWKLKWDVSWLRKEHEAIKDVAGTNRGMLLIVVPYKGERPIFFVMVIN